MNGIIIIKYDITLSCVEFFIKKALKSIESIEREREIEESFELLSNGINCHITDPLSPLKESAVFGGM
jgi:hypothetical protein